MTCDHACKCCSYADCKGSGKKYHDGYRKAPVPGAEQNGQEKACKCEQHLAGIDIVTENGIQKAFPEHISYEISCEQRQRGGIGPEDRGVGEAKEPRCKEAVIIAEGLLGVGVCAACIREGVDHVVIISGYYQHYDSAGNKTCSAAGNAGLCQVSVACNYK